MLKLNTIILCLLLLLPFSRISAAENADEIINQVEHLLWGKTVQGEYEMIIRTPYWQRTLKMKVWMKRPDRSFIRILAPAREKGIGSLRIKNEMWNYLPKVERTLKVPPSMMLQPWMGSDFSNDDLVKESSVINDYTKKLTGKENVGNQAAYRIELIPLPDAAVVWGKIIYFVRVSDRIPLKMEYYDERGNRVKTLSFSEVRELGGRKMPTRWVMQSTAKPDNSTTIVVNKVRFDSPIPDRIFTLRNLRKRQ